LSSPFWYLAEQLAERRMQLRAGGV
jgi:hypothetical protein